MPRTQGSGQNHLYKKCQRTLIIKASPCLWVFLINNNKPILALMEWSSKGCKFQPLKVSINFTALFFLGICLVYMSQSLFSGELTGKELLCVICCCLVVMLLLYGLRTSIDQSSTSYQNAVFWSSGEQHTPQFYCWEDHPGSNDLGIVFFMTNGSHFF